MGRKVSAEQPQLGLFRTETISREGEWLSVDGKLKVRRKRNKVGGEFFEPDLTDTRRVESEMRREPVGSGGKGSKED